MNWGFFPVKRGSVPSEAESPSPKSPLPPAFLFPFSPFACYLQNEKRNVKESHVTSSLTLTILGYKPGVLVISSNPSFFSESRASAEFYCCSTTFLWMKSCSAYTGKGELTFLDARKLMPSATWLENCSRSCIFIGWLSSASVVDSELSPAGREHSS